MQISIQVSGLATAVTILDRVGFAASHRSELVRIATTMVRAQTIRRFSTKTDPDGAGWAPLAASTIAGGRGAGDILVNTGMLRNSIVQTQSGDVGTVRTSVHYAKYHHTGTVKMPKRQFLGVGARDTVEIEAALSAYFKAIIG